jgi:dTDP-4-amino-4,6-dideoxygalactose transaminase
LQPAYRHLTDKALPVAERAAQRILSLPMFPHLSEEQIGRVAAVLRQVLLPGGKLKASAKRPRAMAE